MKNWLVGAAIAALTLISFFQFPGHTWLQQDSQIYTPILEHLRDLSVLRQDILVERPHVSFTLYDECALALRRLTGLGFREVLAGGQIVTRALGIWGFYLMATAAGLAMGPALLVAAILTLGGVIVGPAVLIWEYEPVPRGLAVPLLFLAIGLAAQRRDLGAGVAASAAFLIHPPTVYPFWGVYFVMALWPAKPEIMRRRLYAFVPLLASILLMLFAAHHQAGQNEAQAFFTRLDPIMEKLQRMRASYVWISIWWKQFLVHYLILYAITLAGCFRLRKQMTVDLRFFQIGLPLIGMLSMPVSYLLLERMKWALLPQFQPLRALLFVTVMAMFIAAVAGCAAVARGRLPEAFLWFVVAYVVPVNERVAWPGWERAGVLALLAAIVCAALWSRSRIALAAAALAAFFVVPILGHVTNYPKLHNPELEQLAAWARSSTPPDSVFLFPDARHDLYPGIFRAESLRAVYVDWKGGGQVNYLRDLGLQWWQRWQATMLKPLPPAQYRKLGIDYLVVRPQHRFPGFTPIWQNRSFVVYKNPGTDG